MTSKEKCGTLEARPLQCQYIVPRKKRFCRMSVKSDRKYCPEHERLEQISNGANENTAELDVRIPCPLDPKHTCYSSKLEKHLKVCNARCDSVPAYISKGVNSRETDQRTSRACLKDVPLDKLRKAVDIVERLYEDLVSRSIENNVERERVAVHPALSEAYAQADRRHGSRRHLRQTSSLLRSVEREGLLGGATCFVELGAGKGHVSYYLARALQEVPSCSVLLVDRASHRHKQDNKLDPERHRVSRVRADINDLVLDRVPEVAAADHVVAVSKHLCGVATDYALRCVTAPGIIGKTRGVVMATCCHHQCTLGGYVATDFLLEHGITKEYFDIIMGIVSWGTCGTGYSRERSQEVNENKRQKVTDEISPLNDKIETDVISSDINNINNCKGIYKENHNYVKSSNEHSENTDDCVKDIMNENKSKENKLKNISDDCEIHSLEGGSGGFGVTIETFSNEDVNSISSQTSFTNNECNSIESDISNEKSKTDNITLETKSAPELIFEQTMSKEEIAFYEKRLTSVKALGLTVERRTEIGRRAKALIDYGRVVYLRKCGFETKLCFYVDVDVSPENVCIIAKK